MSQSFRPVIAFMTDFGTGDGDVGVMKAVALGITTDAQIVDITHDIAPPNVASAAWILATAYRYFPKGTVYICVVDPGWAVRGAPSLCMPGTGTLSAPIMDCLATCSR